MKDRLRWSRKLTLAVSQFKKTGVLTPYLQKRMKGNIQLVWELFPGLAPTPDSLSLKLESFHNLQKIHFNPKVVEQFNKQARFYELYTKP